MKFIPYLLLTAIISINHLWADLEELKQKKSFAYHKLPKYDEEEGKPNNTLRQIIRLEIEEYMLAKRIFISMECAVLTSAALCDLYASYIGYTHCDGELDCTQSKFYLGSSGLYSIAAMGVLMQFMMYTFWRFTANHGINF